MFTDNSLHFTTSFSMKENMPLGCFYLLVEKPYLHSHSSRRLTYSYWRFGGIMLDVHHCVLQNNSKYEVNLFEFHFFSFQEEHNMFLHHKNRNLMLVLNRCLAGWKEVKLTLLDRRVYLKGHFSFFYTFKLITWVVFHDYWAYLEVQPESMTSYVYPALFDSSVFVY